MSATQTVWGMIRTAKVIDFDERRECGVAVDDEKKGEIYFEMDQCRKVYAEDNGNPRIERNRFRQWPRKGNRILYILDHRPPSFKGEKPRAFVWAYLHFYLRSLKDQNDTMELEGALDGKFPPAAPAEPVRGNDGHRPKLVETIGHILANLPQAPLTTAMATAVPDWSPGIPGPDAEGPTGESGEETSGDKSPEELATAAGGRNSGKKPKPGQNGWIDGRGRNGRGCRQDWRRWH